jgi:NAD(P)-dependent dehydrogenase (short-subunit alcohol dehydrogenase family)
MVEGKVILVVGGTSGIGEATAILAAKEGAKVAVAGRREDKGREVVAKIYDELIKDGIVPTADGEGEEKRAIFIRCDATKEEDVRNLVASCVAAFGRIDGAFNNAGVMRHTRPLLEIGLHEFQDMMQANAFSALCCMNEEIRQMRKQEEAASVETKSASPVARSGRYSIVNCSSINAERPFTTTGLYGSTKVAIDFLTKTAALEQADVPIRINSVQPGPVATDIFGDLSSIDPTGTLTSRVAIAEFGKRHTLFGAVHSSSSTFDFILVFIYFVIYLILFIPHAKDERANHTKWPRRWCSC